MQLARLMHCSNWFEKLLELVLVGPEVNLHLNRFVEIGESAQIGIGVKIRVPQACHWLLLKKWYGFQPISVS